MTFLQSVPHPASPIAGRDALNQVYDLIRDLIPQMDSDDPVRDRFQRIMHTLAPGLDRPPVEAAPDPDPGPWKPGWEAGMVLNNAIFDLVRRSFPGLAVDDPVRAAWASALPELARNLDRPPMQVLT